MAFATQWGAKTAVWSRRSKPTLGAVPLSSCGQPVGSRNPRLPEVGRDRARGIDDPVGMAEIRRSVGRQLRLVAAQQPVRPGPDPKQRGRDRDADSAAADGGSERLGEFLVGPAAGPAVVWLDRQAGWRAGRRHLEKQADEIVRVEQ